MVGGDDDERVALEAGLAERLEQPADRVVGERDLAVVGVYRGGDTGARRGGRGESARTAGSTMISGATGGAGAAAAVADAVAAAYSTGSSGKRAANFGRYEKVFRPSSIRPENPT